MPQKGSSLLWRCRRGIREMDLILQQFIETHYDKLSNEEKLAFTELLDQQDMDIMDWILERSSPPTKSLEAIIHIIRNINIQDNTKS